ncbi:MAG TPA: rRNA maturation RNase YbeY [Chloroflexota bacterium]|nr:rRNA maturation RNase YbeY [Chloroflexota bacterium]
MEVLVETADGVEAPFDDAWTERVVGAAVAVAGVSVGEAAQLVVLYADDATLQELNRRYRAQDKPTDVLSFEGGAEMSSPACAIHHVGDIAISVDRARRQAEEYGHGFEREVAYLLTHGTLHLLGYDHVDDAEQRRMREAEERALGESGLVRG